MPLTTAAASVSDFPALHPESDRRLRRPRCTEPHSLRFQSGAFPVGSRIKSFQPDAPIVGVAMDSPWFGASSKTPVAHLLVQAYAGSNGNGMNGDLTLGENVFGGPRIAGQEDLMSFGRKNRLRQG